MFTEVPDDDPDDPITATLTEMDRRGVGVGLVNTGRPEAIKRPPPPGPVRARDARRSDGASCRHRGRGPGIRAEHAEHGTRAVSFFPVGPVPQVPVDAATWYPIYATCVELGLPVFVNAGVPARGCRWRRSGSRAIGSVTTSPNS